MNRDYSPPYRLGTEQKVAVASSSAAISNAWGADTYIIRVATTTDCHITIASSPTATIESSSTLRVTIDGSFTTMPLPLSHIRVLAVPRSIATSPEIQFNTLGI